MNRIAPALSRLDLLGNALLPLAARLILAAVLLGY